MLPDFRLEVHFARWEFQARYNLAASDMETWTIAELLQLADDHERKRWEHLPLGYIPTNGTPELRAAIAATYPGLHADDVHCFAGAEEGIFCAMHALLEASDHAIILVPNFQSIEEIPRSICQTTGIALDPATGWRLDLDQIRTAIRPNTRLIAINFPNNPTGHVIPEADFRELIALGDERGIRIFSDEVYRGLERDPAHLLPQAAELSESALSLGVMSKAYGLAGLRVGWIACRDRALLARLERIRHYLSITNAGPSEVLATIALRARAPILDRNRALVERNLAHLHDFFARHPHLFEWYAPNGGCVGFFRYLGADGVEAFCRSAVEDASVLLLPASLFQSSLAPVPEDRFRLGFGRRDFAEGLAALEAHLSTAGRHDAPDSRREIPG